MRVRVATGRAIRIPIESSRFLDSIRLKGVGKDTDFAIWMHRRRFPDCAGIKRNPYKQWCGQFRGGKEEISGTVRLK